MSLEGNQIVLLAPGYGALLLPVRNTCACEHAHNPTMTSWLNSNMVVHTCICIAIQSGNLRALCIFIAKRGRKKKSHPPKTGIQRKRQWMCFTGILQVWERKQEKRSRTGPVLCWWDISILWQWTVQRQHCSACSIISWQQSIPISLMMTHCLCISELTKLWEQTGAQTSSATPTHSFGRRHPNKSLEMPLF